MRRNENWQPKVLQCLADFQGKGTTQQCCIGKNWIIKFPPFPESVPEKYLFSDCNADFAVSNKTQLKLFKRGTSKHCQPYFSSLAQRQQRSTYVFSYTQVHIHFFYFKQTLEIYLFFHSQNTDPGMPQIPLFTLFLKHAQ